MEQSFAKPKNISVVVSGVANGFEVRTHVSDGRFRDENNVYVFNTFSDLADHIEGLFLQQEVIHD